MPIKLSLISACGGLRENLVWEKPQKPLLVRQSLNQLSHCITAHGWLSNSLKQLAH